MCAQIDYRPTYLPDDHPDDPIIAMACLEGPAGRCFARVVSLSVRPVWPAMRVTVRMIFHPRGRQVTSFYHPMTQKSSVIRLLARGGDAGVGQLTKGKQSHHRFRGLRMPLSRTTDVVTIDLEYAMSMRQRQLHVFMPYRHSRCRVTVDLANVSPYSVLRVTGPFERRVSRGGQHVHVESVRLNRQAVLNVETGQHLAVMRPRSVRHANGWALIRHNPQSAWPVVIMEAARPLGDVVEGRDSVALRAYLGAAPLGAAPYGDNKDTIPIPCNI